MAIPLFLACVVIEMLVLKFCHWNFERRNSTVDSNFSAPPRPPPPTYRFNEFFANMTVGIWSIVVPTATSMGLEHKFYTWIFNNVALFHIPFDSPFIWLLTFFAVDLCAYIGHRMSHEISYLWSFHEVHHSSEDYNLSTSFRLNPFQVPGLMFFYLPLALFGIPPSYYFLHRGLNVVFQFWVHTPLIGRLGPLEKFIMTPSLHRVHHGRNPYCIDRNYGCVLVIWDRLFGTHALERPEEEPVVYGTVGKQHESFNAVYLCGKGLASLVQRVWNVPGGDDGVGLVNRVKVILFGPGWNPEKPQFRLGDPDDVPKIHQNDLLLMNNNNLNSMVRFNPHTNWKFKVYIGLHLMLNIFLFLAFETSSPGNDLAVIYYNRKTVVIVLTVFFCTGSWMMTGGGSIVDSSRRRTWLMMSRGVELIRVLLFIPLSTRFMVSSYLDMKTKSYGGGILQDGNADLQLFLLSLSSSLHTAVVAMDVICGVSFVALLLLTMRELKEEEGDQICDEDKDLLMMASKKNKMKQ